MLKWPYIGSEYLAQNIRKVQPTSFHQCNHQRQVISQRELRSILHRSLTSQLFSSEDVYRLESAVRFSVLRQYCERSD